MSLLRAAFSQSDQEFLDQIEREVFKPMDATARHRWLQEELEGRPEDSGADGALLHLTLGALDEAGDRLESARLHYRHGLAIRPDLRPAHHGLDRLLRNAKEWETCLSNLESEIRVVELPAARRLLVLSRAAFLENPLGRPKEALAALNDAASLYPGDWTVFLQRRRLLIGQGDAEGLFQLYSEHLSHEQDDAFKVHWIAEMVHLLRRHLLRPAEALDWCHRGLAFNPKHALLNIEMLELAQRLGEDVEAEPVLRRLLNSSAGEAFKAVLRAQTGCLLMRQGHAEEASGLFLQALHSSPEQPLWLDWLAQAYRESEQWPVLYSLLMKQSERAQGAWQWRLKMESALLLQQRVRTVKNPMEQAVENIRGIPETPGDFLTLHRHLKSLYAGMRRYDALVDLIQNEAARVDWPDFEHAACLWMGILCESALGQPDRARQAYERARALRPGDLFVQALLERNYRAQGHWESLTELHIKQSEWENAGALAHKHAMELAMIAQNHTGQFRQAIDHYDRALALEQTPVFILQTQEALAERADDADRLLATLVAQRELAGKAGQDAVELDLTWRIAEVLSTKTHQDEEAEREWRRIIEKEPGHWMAWWGLEESLGRTGKWRERVELWQEMSRQFPDAGLEARHQCLAFEALMAMLNDPAAASKIAQEQLLLQTQDPWWLHAALRAAERQDEACTLAGLYTRLGHLESDPAFATLWLYKAARLRAGVLNDSGEALAALEEIVQAHPEQWAPLEALGDLMELSGDQARLARLADLRLKQIKPGARRVEETLRWASLQSAIGASPSVIAESLRKALEIQPENFQLMDALMDTVREAGQWDAWLRLADVRRKLEPNPWCRRDLECRAAELAALRASNETEAVKHLKRAMADAAEAGAFDWAVQFELADRYLAQRDWDSLLQLLGKRLAHLQQVPHQIETHLQLACLWERHFSNVAKAAEHYRVILESLDMDHAGAWTQLARLLRRMQDWPGLARHLEGRLKKELSDEEAADIWRVLADLNDQRLNDTPRAIECLLHALEKAPDEVSHYQALAALYEKASQWPSLIETLQAELGFTQEPSRRRELRLKLAHLWRERLGRLNEAVQNLQAALKDNPGDLEIMALLTANLRQGKRWSEAEIVIAAELDLQKDVARRLELEMQLAEARTSQGNTEGAIEALMAAVREHPGQAEPMDAVRPMLAETNRMDLLVEVLDARIKLANDKPALLALLFERAALLDDALGQPDAALETFQLILRKEPRHIPTLIRSARLHSRLGKEDEALAIHGRLREIMGEPEFRKDPALTFELADLLINKGRLDEAETYLNASLAANPMSGGMPANGLFDSPRLIRLANDARSAAARLALERGDGGRAIDMLGGLLEQLQKDARPPEELAPVLERLGGAFFRMKKWRQALGAYQDCLQLVPENGRAWLAAARVLDHMRDTEKSLASYRKALELLQGQPEESVILNEMARISYTETSSPIQARSYLDRILQADPGNLDALRQLKALLSQTREEDQLSKVCRQLVEIETDPFMKASHHVVLGHLHENAGGEGDEEEGVAQYRMALNSHPGYSEALDGLERIYARTGRWDALINEYRGLIRSFPAGRQAEAAPFQLRIARIYDEKMLLPSEAAQAYQAAAKLDPSSIEVHRSAAAFFALSGEMRAEEIRSLLAILQISPWEYEVAHRLVELYVQRKWNDRAWLICKALEFLGALNEAEAAFLQSNAIRMPDLPQRPLESGDMDRHLRPAHPGSGLQGVVTRMNDLILEAAAKPRESLHVRPTERMADAGRPEVQAFLRCCDVGGISGMDWYASPNYHEAVEMTWPPTMICHIDRLEGRRPAEARFILARLAARAIPGHLPVLSMGRDELNRLLLLYKKTQDSSVQVSGITEEDEKNEARRLRKFITWKIRMTLKDNLTDFNGFPRNLDYDRWRESIMEACERFGHLVSGDLVSTLRVLREEDPEVADMPFATGDERRAVLEKSPRLMSMFRFHLSDAHAHLRARTGMSPFAP